MLLWFALPQLHRSARCDAPQTLRYYLGSVNRHVTATGQMGFQVSVSSPPPHGAILIGDFALSQTAEAFADKMREIDAGPSYVSPIAPEG
jgi:hypothetical protein